MNVKNAFLAVGRFVLGMAGEFVAHAAGTLAFIVGAVSFFLPSPYNYAGFVVAILLLSLVFR